MAQTESSELFRIGILEGLLEGKVSPQSRNVTLRCELCGLLFKQFQRYGDYSYLEQAIENGRKVMCLIPLGKPELSKVKENILKWLTIDYGRTRKPAQLNEIITLATDLLATIQGPISIVAKCYDVLIEALDERYNRDRKMDDMNKAISAAEQLLAMRPQKRSSLRDRLHNCSHLYSCRYRQLHQPEDLEAAICKARRAIEMTTKDDPKLPLLLTGLATNTMFRFERNKEEEDLESAAQLSYRVMESPQATTGPNPVALFNNLSNTLDTIYENSNEEKHLQASTDCARTALKFARKTDQDVPTCLTTLAFTLYKCYRKSNQVANLDEAYEAIQEAVRLTKKDDPSLPTRLNNLAQILERRYYRTGRRQDLEEAITSTQRAINLVSEKHPDHAQYLSNLSLLLTSRYAITAQECDLHGAVNLARKAKDNTPKWHPQLAIRCDRLGRVLFQLHRQTGNDKCLTEAVHIQRSCLRMVPSGHGERPAVLQNASRTVHRQYSITGKQKYLHKAIRLAKESVALTSEQDSEYASRLNNMSSILASNFDYEMSDDFSDKAVITFQRSVDETDENDVHYLGRLGNLATSYFSRYDRSGALADLEQSIKVTERVLELTPKNDPDAAKNLGDLCVRLYCRYERSEATEDLQEAIAQGQKGLSLCREGDRHVEMYLKNMSTILASAYVHTKELSTLTRATQYAQKALNIQSKYHLHTAECNSLLGARLGALYEATNEPHYLLEAIQAAEAALKALPKNNIKRASALANLSRMMALKYKSDDKSTRSQWYMEQSIISAQKAVDMQPSSPAKAESLVQLGRSYMLSIDPEYQQRGLEAWMQAWDHEDQRPMDRIKLAISIIDILKDQDRGKAAAIAKQAVRLFNLLNTQALNIIDQQYVASAATGLVTDACSLLLEIEGPEEALRMLELGRARTVSLLIDSRSDSTQVKGVNKELGAEYDRLQAEVNASHHKMDELGGIPHHQFKQRIEALRELQACINKIQRVPGLEGFLKEPEIVDLKASAAEGPVVIINITSIRSDAIIISNVNTIFNLKLNLSWADAKKWALADLTSYQDLQKWGAQNRKFTALLAWLWRCCVKPVLDALELKAGPTSGLSRVWWIGTGIAGLLPFHAAGKGTEHVYQRAISSYIPTIKALMYARSRPIASGNQLLLVTMPKTPGKADLATDDPETLAGSAFRVKHLLQPNSQTVLDNFQDANVVHFVCHGESIQGKPSSSPLYLVKNQSELDRLTVEDISRVHLEDAKLAYLAACSTAQNNATLADEVLHLASGFQVAGFSQVIGSMWVADHEISSAITRVFYAKLQLDLSPRNVAMALHESILEVQSDVVGQPLAWASYIHMGA